MALRKLERRNYGGKWPLSIKYQNPYSFKEGLILLYQSILEKRRITHLHGSAHFTIPLKWSNHLPKQQNKKNAGSNSTRFYHAKVIILG